MVIGMLAGAAIIVNKIGELVHAVLDVRDGIRDRLQRGERSRTNQIDPEAQPWPKVEPIDCAPEMVKEP